MKLATFTRDGGEPTAGQVVDGGIVEFTDGLSVLERIEQGVTGEATGPQHALDAVILLAPIPKPPMIYGIGLNYKSHAAEIGAEPPAAPIVFPKSPGSSTGPSGPVVCPSLVRRLDYEGELVVVMGPNATVFGYAIADDVSSRDLQKSEPHWIRAKGSDTFCPWGPWITTADEIDDVEALVVKCWVNGEQRQEAAVSDLVHPIPNIISFITEAITLHPGDLLLTGTPGGVGMAMDPPQFLAAGDTVRIAIDQLGSIEHSVVAG